MDSLFHVRVLRLKPEKLSDLIARHFFVIVQFGVECQKLSILLVLLCHCIKVNLFFVPQLLDLGSLFNDYALLFSNSFVRIFHCFVMVLLFLLKLKFAADKFLLQSLVRKVSMLEII